MKKLWIFLGLVLFLPAAARAEFDHSAFDRVLKQFVTEQGRVDYAALKARPEDLNRYVEQLAERSPFSHPADFSTRESKLAYWINAYNAFVMKGVVDAWPTDSVRSIRALYGFFWRIKFTAGGERYTLRHIENEFLRKQLNEARIHFAIVCASNGCPRLARAAYTAENCERMLEEAARFYFSESRNLKIDAARNEVSLNYILNWYREDFENWVRRNRAGSSQPLLDYVKVYAAPDQAQVLGSLKNPKLRFNDYDWGINDIRAPNPSPKYSKAEAAP